MSEKIKIDIATVQPFLLQTANDESVVIDADNNGVLSAGDRIGVKFNGIGIPESVTLAKADVKSLDSLAVALSATSDSTFKILDASGRGIEEIYLAVSMAEDTFTPENERSALAALIKIGQVDHGKGTQRSRVDTTDELFLPLAYDALGMTVSPQLDGDYAPHDRVAMRMLKNILKYDETLANIYANWASGEVGKDLTRMQALERRLGKQYDRWEYLSTVDWFSKLHIIPTALPKEPAVRSALQL